jgi:molecular chaperone DnaJ
VERSRDLYGLLGVPRDATPERIRAAYRKLARRCHPDVGGGSAEQFRALQQAYETLSNPETRARYDRALDMDRRPASGALPVSVSYHDTGWTDGPEGASGEVLLSPQEAAVGGIMALEIPIRMRCRDCGGSGGAAGSLWMCAACDGYGVRPVRVPVSLQIPPGLRDGTIFQVRVDDPVPLSVILAVHILKR